MRRRENSRPGRHAVDLFRWCAGEFTEAYGRTGTCFWPMEVEDNAFALFSREDGVMASMHTSWTQWKNLFRFEIFGDEGYLAIQGLGGSYGTGTLTRPAKAGGRAAGRDGDGVPRP